MKINRRLNFGRSIIKDFLLKSMPFSEVLDIGAGNGTDLMSAKEVNNKAQIYAIDYHELHLRFVTNKCFQINIEQEKIPLSDSSIDVIPMCQDCCRV